MKGKKGRLLLLGLLGILTPVILGLTGTLALRGSLARLDGQARVPGLQGPVAVTRDALGVPDIAASSRQDAARTLGYLHAQDRFFQMDLLRRAAAGRLAELLGPAVLETDRDTRRHLFSRRAERVLAAASPAEAALLEAYAAGVNAGLEDLRVRPPEYLFLRVKPEPWRPADTILTLHAMFLDLSYSNAATEKCWAAVRDNLPEALTGFLLPRSNRWEAPLQTDPVPGIVIPDSNEIDVRTWTFSGKSYREFQAELDSLNGHQKPGSNNWAVAGRRTAHGGALLASDMHLSLRLPNTWYRARLTWPEGDRTRALVGLTLPGTPLLVSGSNGQLAWGFTTSYGDFADLVILETDSTATDRYLTPDGWRTMTPVTEVIAVKGAPADTLRFRETIWGPVWDADSKGRPRALRWVAHDTEAANLKLAALEMAATVEEAALLAGTLGVPPMNLVCADSRGHIAWAHAGRIPRRLGWDGRLPVSWSDGSCRWDGYYPAQEQPRIVDPDEGLVWTANNRVVAGRDLARLGDAGYALGPRARQIRDRLRRLDHASEADMLAIQLDDEAWLMGQWRDLILEVLARHTPDPGSGRERFLAMVRDHWEGRAAPGSVSYRLVHHFKGTCEVFLYELLTGKLGTREPGFRQGLLPGGLAVTWEVLNARPAHLLAPWCTDWDDFMLQAVDQVMDNIAHEGIPLEQYTWGRRNTVQVAHPFLAAAPRLERWLAAPARPLPGDYLMPRVQSSRFGASDRLVVSPGREELGILHMPGGQSGHPLSPYFLAGHHDWEKGKPTPLLPGPAVHRLVLVPR